MTVCIDAFIFGTGFSKLCRKNSTRKILTFDIENFSKAFLPF